MALHMTETTSRLTLIVGLSVIMASCSSNKAPSAMADAPITVTDRVSSQQKYTQAQADRDNRQRQGNLTVAVPRVYVDDDQIESDAPNSYTVVRGDTLWDISDRFLKEPWRWTEIWGYNPQVVNPDLIYPGDKLALNYVNGKPTLSLTRNNQLVSNPLVSPGSVSGVRASASDDANAYRNVADNAGVNADSNERVKLSPMIRSESLEDAIPMISNESISQFLIHPLVLENSTITEAPYIIANDEDRLIASTGSKIYVRGRLNRANTSYGVYRKSEALIDPVSGAHLGYEVTHVSDAKLLSVGDPSTLTLTSNKKETITGDFLLPLNNEATPSQYVQRLPKLLGDARIVSLVDAISQSGRNQVVVLNVGAESSIQTGDVLAVETSGHAITDTHRKRKGDRVNLPNQRTGVVMVFRTFDKVSYALVMESTRPIKVNDFVTGI